jgi:hypothetical protein
MEDLLEMVVVFTGLLVVGALMAQYLLRFLYSYAITQRYVEARLIGLIPFYRVRLRDIQDAKVIPFKDAYRFKLREIFTVFRCGNRLWGKGVVLIEKRGGVVRLILITPDDPREFVANILRKKSGVTND